MPNRHHRLAAILIAAGICSGVLDAKEKKIASGKTPGPDPVEAHIDLTSGPVTGFITTTALQQYVGLRRARATQRRNASGPDPCRPPASRIRNCFGYTAVGKRNDRAGHRRAFRFTSVRFPQSCAAENNSCDGFLRCRTPENHPPVRRRHSHAANWPRTDPSGKP